MVEAREGMEDFCQDIESYFNKSDNIISSGRNIIKIVEYNGKRYSVKSFKIPHLLNRFAYRFIRGSKAKRSYLNGLKLGEFTPKPICYKELKKGFLFSSSYYVCEHYNCDFTLREPLLDKSFKDRDMIFMEFANFTYRLHQKNIYHLDYSPGNILIKKIDNRFDFKIIDINRLIFKELGYKERVENFSKLWADDSDLEKIVGFYCLISGLEEKQYKQMALFASKRHKSRKNLKKRLKGKKVVD